MFLPGLLASAHRGILYVDDINLLDTELCQILLGIVADGWVNVEVSLNLDTLFAAQAAFSIVQYCECVNKRKKTTSVLFCGCVQQTSR